MSSLGVILAGGLQKFADKKVEYLDKREEDERDERKAKFLESLRRDTAKELADYQETLAAKRPDEKMSTMDYETGTLTQRDRAGNVISERKLTAAEIEEYQAGKKKNDLAIRTGEAQIRNLDDDNARGWASLELDKQRAADSSKLTKAQIKALDAEAAASSVGSMDIGRELVNDYQDVVAEAVEAGVPRSEITKLAANAAAQAKARKAGYNLAQQTFVDGLRILKAGVGSDGTYSPAAVRDGAVPGYRRAKGLDQ